MINKHKQNQNNVILEYPLDCYHLSFHTIWVSIMSIHIFLYHTHKVDVPNSQHRNNLR